MTDTKELEKFMRQVLHLAAEQGLQSSSLVHIFTDYLAFAINNLDDPKAGLGIVVMQLVSFLDEREVQDDHYLDATKKEEDEGLI